MSKLAVYHYRVPTQEERRAALQKIAQVRELLRRCAALRERLERFEPVEGEDLPQTLARYDRAVAEQRWDDFVEDYNRLYDSLPALEQRLEQQLAAAKGRRLRLELTARTLAGDASGEEKPLLEAIARGAKMMRADALDAADAKIEAVLARRLNAASGAAASAVSAAQSELARALRHPDAPPPERISGLGRQALVPPLAGEADRSRVERLIAQLSALDEDAGHYIDRVLAIAGETDGSTRAMQLDSLVIEISEREAGRRAARDLSRLTGEALAELTPFDSPAADIMRERLRRAADVGEARALFDEARALAAAEAKRRDGALARAAMLKALSGLGYELRLQGEAWAEGTQLEIQRPGEPNYDVQLSAPPNGRIQSKVRAYAHAGRGDGVNRRDVEVEQSWCDDLRALNALMQAEGFAADIVHEEGPGSAAQKPLPAREAAREDAATAGPRARGVT
ncbi:MULTISPECIES: hypothetical protein [Rhodomicrobium]|uniref:hypothetical protein n=1 Tax=Rhodomicrobium TaxID=1068 RepID=UPI000B4B2D56|nr:MULTISPECIES: hypothetical protein [Rhodomicrobium]